MLAPINIRELVSPVPIVNPDFLQNIDGDTAPHELLAICQLVAHFQPKRIFEFGTFRGRTTYNLAKHTTDDAKIYTITIEQSRVGEAALPFWHSESRYADCIPGELFLGTPEERKITQLLGDSAMLDVSVFAKKMDFCFIDASHSYENCMSDSLKAVAMKSRRGIVLWHDYGLWDGVTNCLDDLRRSSAAFERLKRIEETSYGVLMPQ